LLAVSKVMKYKRTTQQKSVLTPLSIYQTQALAFAV